MNSQARFAVVTALGAALAFSQTVSWGQPSSFSAANPTDAQPADMPPHFPGAELFNNQPPFLAGVAVNRADGVYRDGEKLSVQFQSERAAHLYLIYHQADGTSVLMFPNQAQPNNRVPAREPVIIPGLGEPFRFRIRPPLGTEVLQVLAALSPLNELDNLVQPTDRFPVVSNEIIAKLRDRMAKDPTSWTEHRVPIHTIAKHVDPETRTPERVGLFIGIGKYLHPEFAPTHEELGRSAAVMHDLMLKHGGLDPERARLVLNEQATKSNLEELIARWLPSVSQPGDTVFIYFSGHAGQLETNDRSETDGRDETLGPYDLNAGASNLPFEQRQEIYRRSNILDDTLARWLQELQGRQIVLILDTCHSGGVVQGKSLARSFLASEAARVKDITQLNTLILASCAADEQSLFEGTRNKTMWFTYCLTEAIESAGLPRPLSVQQAYDYSRRRMRELLREGNAAREQEPQMTDNVLLPVVLAP
jgi:hypothetical protein